MTSTTKTPAKRVVAKPGPPNSELKLSGGETLAEEWITPAIAEQYMELNRSNRKLKERQVAAIARDMLAGNWQFEGNPVRFDKEGYLCDAQHRLQGLIVAGRENPDLRYRFLVLRGVAEDAKAVIDSGVKRSVADQLRMNGHGHSVVLAGAARWALTFDRAVLEMKGAQRSITNSEVIDYIDQNPDLEEVVSIVVNRYKKKIDMPATLMAASFYILWRVDEEAAKDFFMRIATGVGLDEGDPILALKSRLREVKDKRTSVPEYAYLSMVLRAWNYRRDGRTMTTMPLMRGGRVIEAPEPY